MPFVEDDECIFLKTIIPSRKMSSVDLRDLQVRAMKEGIPYQTLMASVLHKYVTGRLVERPVDTKR